MDERMPMVLRDADKKQYPHECDICGRPLKRKIQCYGLTLCYKHYMQARRNRWALDTNPRTVFDMNDIRVIDGVAYMDLYDKRAEKVATTIFDAEDISKAVRYKWRLCHGYVNVANKKTKCLMLHRLIMDADGFVDHINHDTLDNRKANLRIVNKSQNSMNSDHKGVTLLPKGGYYAHIKKNQRMLNLGHYEHEEQALYARWYAEQILFGEYAFKKDEPDIPGFMKEEIRDYVDKKVQRL